MHYRAFISHSHADAKFAAWLQRAIETWRVPTRLRSELGYSRIKPVFRDRTDLRAATSLGDALEDALKHSSALIVVCSNEAADSEWVDQEIARYREVNPDAPVLPIIASGEPPHCFPESLLVDANGNALEPLAADARKGFDGKRDALLKTIAGIIDVDFDVLKQRDFRRRQQKMGAVAALSTAIAAVTLYLAYVAYEARDDANRRREQADDLIAFMLGDLREKLEPIGKLEILDAVGDEALEYFSESEMEEISADAQLNYAIAMRQIGEVRMAEGLHGGALDAFRSAHSMLDSMIEEFGPESQIVYERGQTEFWIGMVYYEKLELTLTRDWFGKYADTSLELVYIDSTSLDYKIERAMSLINLAALEVEDRNFGRALAYIDNAIDFFGSFSEELDDVSRLDLQSDMHSWRGEAAYRSGQLEIASESYLKEFSALKELVSISDDQRYIELLSNSGRRFAQVEILLGRREGVAEYTETALAQAEQLTELDPLNYYWWSALAATTVRHSQALYSIGERGRAMEVVVKVRPRIEILLKSETVRAGALASYLSVQAEYSRLLRSAGDYAGSMNVIDDCLKLLQSQPQLEGAAPLSAPIAQLLLIHGDLLKLQDQESLAMEAWSNSLPMTEVGRTDRTSPLDLIARTALMERLGYLEEAGQIRFQLDDMGIHAAEEQQLAEIFLHGGTL